jgi:hypothetical protein
MDMVNRLLNAADDATVDEHGIASNAYILMMHRRGLHL